MSRTPVLTAVLWTSVGVAAIGCDDPAATIVDAAGPDASAIDGTTIDAVPAALTFAPTLTMEAACGGSTVSADLTITNVAGVDVVVTDVAITGGFQIKVATPTTIAAGGTLTITVAPPAAVIGTDVGGGTVTGSLTITADRGAALAPVALTSNIIGANLVLTDSALQPISTLALNTTDGSCPAPATVVIRNTGNSGVNLFDSGASSFSLGGFSPSSSVPAGGMASTTVSVRTFGGCASGETINYQAVGPVCTVLPLALSTSFNITGTSSCFCS